ncbi:MAG: biotin operon repressor, partial [Candidatus Ornithomonoglobus sp.]
MRNKILDMLKNTESYISGEEMSRALGISRAAVWKHIKRLKDDGYEILSVTNKGYKLQNIPDIISETSISSVLNTEFMARNIKYMPIIDS